MRFLSMMVFIFMVLPFQAQAQDSAALEPKQAMEKFFQALSRGEVDKAYDDLLVNGPVAEKAQSVAFLKSQTKTGTEMYGSILSHELYREEMFGSSVQRLVYILKTEAMPLIWNAYFYKPKEEWVLVNIKFSDEEFDLQNLQP